MTRKGSETLKRAPEKTKHRLDIFARLHAHGIDRSKYAKIKQILFFEQPNSLVYFDRLFPGQSPSRVLRQIGAWEKLLEKDFVLLPEQRSYVKQALAGTKTIAWRALGDIIFPHLGKWKLSRVLTTFEENHSLRSITQLEALNETTGERRVAILGEEVANRRGVGAAWEQAFADLRLLTEVFKESPPDAFVSGKHRTTRFLLTQVMIPRLYEFMLPFYPTPGHVTNKESVYQRKSLYPQALLEDIGAILEAEFPAEHSGMRPAKIKAILHRHLARQSTEIAKKA